MRGGRAYGIVVSLMVMVMTSSLPAQVRMTREDALTLYFPGAEVTRKTVFLTAVEAEAIQTRARTNVESKIVTYYRAAKNGATVGTAFLETKTVRTMPATFIVVINPDTSVRAVEMLAFHEPEDYLPSARWLGQFAGKGPDDDLFLKRGIHSIAGSTLSAQAISDAVRRIIATYELVVPAGDMK